MGGAILGVGSRDGGGEVAFLFRDSAASPKIGKIVQIRIEHY